jgi:uncharacterized protein involved in response to NO
MTVSMMARVSLGHSGRSVHEAPLLVTAAIVLLLAAVAARVLLPAVLPNHYALLVLTAQQLWIAAFACLLLVYAPILTTARADGKPG